MTTLYHAVYAVAATDNNDPATAQGLAKATVEAEACPVNGKRVIITSRAGDKLIVGNEEALGALIVALREAHAVLRKHN